MPGMGRGTAQRAVEGRCGTRDCVRHAVWITQHVSGGNVQDGEAVRPQDGIATCVARWAFTTMMRLAVYLDGQSIRGTVEVEHVSGDRMLAAELHAGAAAAQALPEQHFRQTH